jgi:DNA-binding MarR family transcriptional regulator
MRLEKEINQRRPFKSEFHKATANLVFTHNWLSVKLKTFLKPHGCTLQQYNVLRILKGAKEPISTSEIRSRMIEKMADTSRLVERLCGKGWVNRQACCGDKRLVDVTISEEGLEFLQALDDFNDYVESLYINLNGEELIQLNTILDKLRIK